MGIRTFLSRTASGGAPPPVPAFEAAASTVRVPVTFAFTSALRLATAELRQRLSPHRRRPTGSTDTGALTAATVLPGADDLPAAPALVGTDGLAALTALADADALTGLTGTDVLSALNGLTDTDALAALTGLSGADALAALTGLTDRDALAALTGLTDRDALAALTGLSGADALAALVGVIGADNTLTVAGPSGVTGTVPAGARPPCAPKTPGKPSRPWARVARDYLTLVLTLLPRPRPAHTTITVYITTDSTLSGRPGGSAASRRQGQDRWGPEPDAAP
ncbi:hypothetical protein [Streptomyces collinus]|uniref:Uncharacterized protein n=1 Tax=Streptomyces collinus TaxID=42684 RepID=A0AA89TF88_STRCU|nr:hypothetical protein [Streptomyces collinus]MBB5810369.1 hypothetical protein [Streptomyces collinus]WMX63654.1 hypothetical protein RFN52_09950 [Streptomyces collinus]